MKRNLNSQSQTRHANAPFGVTIPACNEEACIKAVLEELLRVIVPVHERQRVADEGLVSQT
jgi:hypothetical protein